MAIRNVPDAKVRVMWVIHGAFIAAVPIYMVLLHIVFADRSNFGGIPVYPPSTLFVGAITISVVEVFVGLTIVDKFLQADAARSSSVAELIEKIQRRAIVNDAFLEAIAIYGMVGRIVGLDLWQSFSLMAAAFVLLIFQTTRIKGWVEEYEQRKRRES